ncbi:MAG: hypothetical protein D6752_06625 [Candidatus Nitrosothermus koennekii]|nr:MAG: hypothetical protein D6752_06625 [Candidatus Nitrosothermus koennekii]
MIEGKEAMQPSNLYYKRFAYLEHKDAENKEGKDQLSKEVMDKMMMSIGREVIRERKVSNEELEQNLQGMLKSEGIDANNLDENSQEDKDGDGTPIMNYLKSKGYLKDGDKILTKKSFNAIGAMILRDVMKALKEGDFGMHETVRYGNGTTVLDTSKPYEIGNDIRLLNVPKSLLNTVQRLARSNVKISIPLSIAVDDFEEFETMEDVRTAVAYCIDLSSTMRYSTMLGDMSRIEVAKRALWGLYVLNNKFFPTDSIYIIGFGALASKVKPEDIPYLKTFEPGNDFLHYTNYQAAFRLASKVLNKDGAINKRIVLITDGHPSACFVDNEYEKEKILAARSYTHFYQPDKNTLDNVKDKMNMKIDTTSGDLVYLCYRYKKVDKYIGDKTITEAKKCYRNGIEIDTIMVSEEDALLSYVNEMEKHVKGRSYYINPANLEQVLITDYIQNKKRRVNTKRL